MTDQQPLKSVKDQVALTSYIDDLIREKNDQSLTQDKLKAVKEALLKQLNEMINTHLVILLSEIDQKELDGLLVKKVSDEELDNFFIKKIPNLSAEIATVLVNFRTAFLFKLPNNS